MEKENAAFIKLIDRAVLILSEREKDENYKIFHDRYGKMMEYLEKLRSPYMKKTIDKTKVCLNIVPIVAVNRYYQEHIYSEK